MGASMQEAQAAIEGVPVDTPRPGGTLAAGAIAGIAVAAVVAALAAVAIALWLLRRRRRRAKGALPAARTAKTGADKSTVRACCCPTPHDDAALACQAWSCYVTNSLHDAKCAAAFARTCNVLMVVR